MTDATSSPAPEIDRSAALVLFSGGQDSTVCLAWALKTYDRVETIGFDYGQRHRIELDQRPRLLDGLRGLETIDTSGLGGDLVLAVPTLKQLGATAMTDEIAFAQTEAGLPNTFVPGRNLIFLTYAAGYAYRRGIATLVGGMCETDYSGYPDCRDETLQTLARALTRGLDSRVAIATPLMWATKAETWAMADALGGRPFVDLIVGETHTCYAGDRATAHEWGYGCAACPACDLRAKGWREWRASSRI